MTVDQRCGTCRHWRESADVGVCQWEWMGEVFALPEWMSGSPITLATFGTNCPTWEATDE